MSLIYSILCLGSEGFRYYNIYKYSPWRFGVWMINLGYHLYCIWNDLQGKPLDTLVTVLFGQVVQSGRPNYSKCW